MDQEQAQAALAAAGEVGARTRKVGRWYANFATVYGVVSAGCMLVIGLTPDIKVAMAVFLPAWAVTLAVLLTYAARQRVTPPNFKRTHFLMIGTWAAAWTAGVWGGALWFPGAPEWYVPVALLTAAPPFAAAYSVLRAARTEAR